MDSDDETYIKVIQAIADREDVDPVELEPPLQHVVDTEALGSIFPGDEEVTRGYLTFVYCDYEVTVESSGDVSIEAVAPQPGASDTTAEGSI